MSREVDHQTVQDVLATFRRADDEIRSRDLDATRALNASQYNYHGIKKAAIRKDTDRCASSLA